MSNRNEKKRSRKRGRAFRPLVDPVFAEELSSGRRSRGGPGGGQDERSRRKALQLCRQVYQVLCLTLGGECDDDLLRDLTVESVVPWPNASRLMVRVVLPPGSEVGTIEVLDRLSRVEGPLRRSVAQAITRKRAPELAFMIVPAGSEVQP